VGSGRAGEVVHGNAGWVLGFWVDMNLVIKSQKLCDWWLFIYLIEYVAGNI
jgi:hypothetical protein